MFYKRIDILNKHLKIFLIANICEFEGHPNDELTKGEIFEVHFSSVRVKCFLGGHQTTGTYTQKHDVLGHYLQELSFYYSCRNSLIIH